MRQGRNTHLRLTYRLTVHTSDPPTTYSPGESVRKVRTGHGPRSTASVLVRAQIPGTLSFDSPRPGQEGRPHLRAPTTEQYQKNVSRSRTVETVAPERQHTPTGHVTSCRSS